MSTDGAGNGTRLPAGVSVGHWTDAEGLSGCAVLLVPGGAVGGVDVRGGAPGTINTDGLRPGTVTEWAHAVLLTGGSTFGLAATAGVLRYLEERGIGLPFGPVRVPIVGGAVIFDLLAGDPTARPGPDAGYAACEAATATPAQGAAGAGTGASVAKAGGSEPRLGGFGIASAQAGGAVVAAAMVANSLGGIWDDDSHEWVAPLTAWDYSSRMIPGGNTTIGAVLTDARFCLATGTIDAPVDAVEAVAAQVVARAIAAGVRAAQR